MGDENTPSMIEISMDYGCYSATSAEEEAERRARFRRWLAATIRQAKAEAWEQGHRSCTCDRPGGTPCRNPYRIAGGDQG